jgi:hypothetical protein
MAGQRLVSKEIDKRAVIYPDKTIRRVNDGVNGLMIFGQNNDYPQVMERLINKSSTAKNTANIYASFLEGQGFENEAINDIVVGRDSRGKSITMKRILNEIARSVSINNGFYIHCNLNLEMTIVSTYLRSFKDMRFAMPDDTGYSAKLLYYTNWEKDRKSMSGRYDKRKIVSFNVFNRDEKAFAEQVKKAGTIEDYKGQVYFQFLDNQFFYPLSNYDEVYLDCDTEGEIALYKNRQLRNGFFKKTIIRVQPGGNDDEKDEFVDTMRQSLGPDGNGLFIIEDDLNADGELSEDTGFKTEQLESDIEDDLFENIEKSVSNNIRKAAKGLPALLIDYEESKLGNTSGESITQAVNFYNAITEKDRQTIEQGIEEVYRHFNNPVLQNNTDWRIRPLNLIEQSQDGITNTSTTESD